MAKIVILSGSPRLGGNTSMLVQSFLDGVDKTKYTVKVIGVVGKKIGGCLGCDCCVSDSRHACVQNDGMNEIYDEIKDADIIVAATPIYFYGVSGQLKCIIDRFHNPIRNGFKVKKLILLAVCADGVRTNVFDSVKSMYKSILTFFSLEDGGIVTASGVRAKGDIKGNKALIEAKNLAASL